MESPMSLPPLERCSACGFVSPSGMLFCGRCGSSLSGSSRNVDSEKGATELAPSERQERRRLTILFCDLAQSTLMSEQMDVEAFDALLSAYQEKCGEAVRRYDGFVARYVGDGILVLFGYPIGMENTASRAVRAARAILAAMDRLNCADRLGAPMPLAVRIGIATGAVVVGDLVEGVVEHWMVHGLAPNLAARLQGAAGPGQILISEETQRLVADEFELRDLGELNLKGLSHPHRAFAVIDESQGRVGADVRSRLAGSLTFGRDQELALLSAHWARLAAGSGGIILIRGEPGIGKSRLVQEFVNDVRDEPHNSLTFECSPYHRNTAFYPVASELRRMLQIDPETKSSLALASLRVMVEGAGLPRAEAVPLLAEMLVIDIGTAYPRLFLTPALRRERLLEILAALLREQSARRPLLAVIEDYHWADPSTAETTAELMRQLQDDAVLWVVTQRPGYPVAWLEALRPTIIDLDRLDQGCSIRLARAVAGGSLLPSPTIQTIAERADGIPLFVEELTKNAMEALTGSAAAPTMEQSAVPVSLQDSLVARLDRLRHGKPLAQVASVLGRRFYLPLLERVMGARAAQLAPGLQELIEAGLMCHDSADPDYCMFRHALMRDTAYETLLMRVRRRLHRDVGQAISADFPALTMTEPEVVAQHLTLGQQWPEAVDAWLAAGQGALRRLNLTEAIAHFQHGIALLAHLTEGAVRESREMAMQAGMGAAQILRRGYGAPEVKEAYGRAYELAAKRTDDARVFPIVWGFWSHKVVCGEHMFGQAAADHLSLIAETTGDPALRMLSEAAQGLTRCVRGDFAGCVRHASQAVALYDPVRDGSLALVYTIDPKTMALLFLQHAAWIQGQSLQADEVDAACRAWADELGLEFMKPYVAIWGGLPLLYAQRYDELLPRLEAGIACARAGRLDHWTNSGERWRGAVLIGQGHVEQGIALLEQQLASYRGAGNRMSSPYLCALLAHAYCGVGRAARGKALIAEAVLEAASSGEGMHEAEIRRLQGDILLKQSEPDKAGAERCYREALALAQRQCSHAWGLRAALSLAELLDQLGRRADVGSFLRPALENVAATHSAPEVHRAKALLRAL
jgi:class 3 adenylate cyclase/predicted ATPase